MLTIVCGAQYGSEGKGKVAQHFMYQKNAKAVVRCGGPNSGHTVYVNNKKYILRQLPVSALTTSVMSIIPAGAYIDVPVLMQEIKDTGVDVKRIMIDPNAFVIHNSDKKDEAGDIVNKIASTGCGVGAATKRRIGRHGEDFLAKNHPQLEPFLMDVKTEINTLMRNNHEVIIEGTQGYGLSMCHSKDYPFVTSRDTTSAAFLADVGVSMRYVSDIVLVVRSRPIRVAGNSGPLPDEISWEKVSKTAGSDILEHTSVTGNERRVADFGEEAAALVKEAIMVNGPTKIVLNHADYVMDGFRRYEVTRIEDLIGVKFDYIGCSGRGLMSREKFENDEVKGK